MPEPKANLEQFTANNLDTLSPYRIRSFETVTKPVTTKDGRTFNSKSHVLVISPQQNPSLQCQVTVFDKDFQQMKTIAFLHGGFDKVWFKAMKDDSKPRTPNIYTGFEG